jgi:hypothetical protein
MRMLANQREFPRINANHASLPRRQTGVVTQPEISWQLAVGSFNPAFAKASADETRKP